MEFNLAAVHEAIEAAIPEQDCIVWRDRRLSWREVGARTRRLANYLRSRGLGCHRERAGLANHESGQDHLALYLYNGNEYLEAMLGAFKARVAPVNVNYRYVEKELLYLLRDAGCRAVIYHASLASRLRPVLAQIPTLEVLIQVDDEPGVALLEGAVAYEEALAGARDNRPDLTWSADDLYILYTGGTTGMPKGVLWRQGDVFVSAMGGLSNTRRGSEFDSLEAIVARARRSKGKLRILPAPPFMHGAAHWSAFHCFHSGGAVVIQDHPDRLDAADIWSCIARERVASLLLVGDAFARPLYDELQAGDYETSSLRLIVNGGAALSVGLKRSLIDAIDGLVILDAVGSSESGGQAQHFSSRQADASTGTFVPNAGNMVLSQDMTHVLRDGESELGWLARTGRVPLGYLGDEAKTARTFPVIEGERCAIPGDRARLRGDAVVELYGRDSATVNSGGEKIFAEEVEQALKTHPSVYDAVVVGRPSQRWGSEVVAIVSLSREAQVSEDELLETCSRHLARYKLPKLFIFKDKIVRSPAGKPDYRWAKQQLAGLRGKTGRG